MKRHRYELITGGDVQAVNRLFALGWSPVREVVVDTSPSGEGEVARGVLVLFERDDAFPLWQGETLGGEIAFSVLANVPLFEGLNSEELRELVAACELVAFEEGATVFDEGQQDQALFVLLEGEVAIHFVNLPLEEPNVLQAGPLDVFGESTFFSPAAHSTKAEAITRARALRLGHDKYNELLQGQRSVAYKLAVNAAGILGQRLQETDRWIQEILEQEQNGQIAQSWHRFRRRISHEPESSAGFFHI